MAGRTVQVPTVNDNVVHGEWTAGEREVLRVTTGAFNGRQTVRLSLWWKPRGATENDPFLPSKRGVTFPLECGGVISEIAEALEDAVEAVTTPQQPSTNGKAESAIAAENDALKQRLAAMENVLSGLSAKLDPPTPQPRKRARKQAASA